MNADKSVSPPSPKTQEKQHHHDIASRYVLGSDPIGKAARVVVNPKTRKTASAHDLRRSFGDRWAQRVMPAVLMELMRHESIDTTMRYYVGRKAKSTAAILWQAAEAHAVGESLGVTPQLAKNKPR